MNRKVYQDPRSQNMTTIAKSILVVAILLLVFVVHPMKTFADNSTQTTNDTPENNNVTYNEPKDSENNVPTIVFLSDGVDLNTGNCAENGDTDSGGEPKISSTRNDKFVSEIATVMALLEEAFDADVRGVDITILEARHCRDTMLMMKELTRVLTSRTVIGIITAMAKKSASTVVHFVSSLQLPVVEMVSGDDVIKESISDFHFIVPHYRHSFIQIFFDIAKRFNWTAISALDPDVNFSGGSNLLEIFQAEAFQHDLCVIPFELSNDSIPLMAFDGWDLRKRNITLNSPNQKVVFVSGESESVTFDSKVKYFTNVVLATATDVIWTRIFQNISSICQLSIVNESNQTESVQKFCLFLNSLDISRTTSFVMNGNSFLTALSFILQHARHSYDYTCDSSFAPMIQTCSLFDPIMHDLDETLKIVKPVYNTEYATRSNPGQMKATGSFVQQRDIHFEEMCHLCYTCFPKRKGLTTATKSHSSGVYTIIGFFPFHSNDCQKIDIEGSVQALLFLQTIDTMNGHLNSQSMAKFQGVVIDSCGSPRKIDSVIEDIENCRYSFPSNTGRSNIAIQPNTILSYVWSPPRRNRDKLRIRETERTFVTISDNGYSSYGDTDSKFTNNLYRILISIKWTVVNVIVSQTRHFISMSYQLQRLGYQNEFCVANILQVFPNKARQSEIIDSLMALQKQTSIFILFTSENDTVNLMDTIYKSKLINSSSDYNFVFTSWNSAAAVSFENVTGFRQNALIIKTKLDSDGDIVAATNVSSLLPYASNQSTLFRLLKSDPSSVQLLIEKQTKYVQLLQQSIKELLEKAKLQDIRNKINVESTDLDIFLAKSSRNDKQRIGTLSTTLEWKKDVYIEQHDYCKTWCPSCNACHGENKLEVTYFHKPGDFNVTSLFSLHEKGSNPFQCERVHDPGRSEFDFAAAFIFAIETFRVRYPNFNSGLSVGGLLLDSCSDQLLAVKTIADFESCRLNMTMKTEHKEHDATTTSSSESSDLSSMLMDTTDNPSPKQNLVYFVQNSENRNTEIDYLSINMTENLFGGRDRLSWLKPESVKNSYTSNSVVKTVIALGWKQVILLNEDVPELNDIAQHTLIQSFKNDLCVVMKEILQSGNDWRVEDVLQLFPNYPVILVARPKFVTFLFNWLGKRAKDYIWVIHTATTEWAEAETKNNNLAVPVGTIRVSVSSTKSPTSFSTEQDSNWAKEFWKLRYSCDFSVDSTTPCPDINLGMTALPKTDLRSTVIRKVDAVIHKINQAQSELCGEHSGVCKELASAIESSSFGPQNVSYRSYGGEMVSYDGKGQLVDTLTIHAREESGFVKIGTYFQQELILDMVAVEAILTDENSHPKNKTAVFCKTCKCVTDIDQKRHFDELPAYKYHSEQERLIDEIWTKVILSISCGGAFLSLCLLLYVVCKVCQNTIGRRYVGLGLYLLISLALLYLSVIPFTLTPSEVLCGLRYVMPAMSFTLVFAGVLAKLMSLQNHKLIGLGGEVSVVNQFITVFFVVVVQVSISAHWWYYYAPTMKSKRDVFNNLKYFCVFDKLEYCLTQVFNLFLLLVCCLYALCVRKEKKNMGEGKLLCISTWLCVLVWIAWPLCLYLLEDSYIDKTISVAVLACACIFSFVVFIPKVKMVASLKYDVSQKGQKIAQNIYSVDSDFLYERPFALPATLNNGFSTLSSRNIPKSVSSLDFDINY